MKPTEQVMPRLGAVVGNRWSFLALIVGIMIAFGSILVIAAAEMTKKRNGEDEAIFATTVPVAGTPYRIRESVTRLPNGNCVTVIERFQLWNGHYLLRASDVSTRARTERSCE